ncbi:MAG: DUF4339 domain-containing protein [Planctomycetes bacterium]|nr:DUF4339 domain-containing protein [Planctomycetota bacterium]
MQIFIVRDNQRQGPFTLEEINDKLRSGAVIASGTFAWYEGCSDWITLDRVPGLFMLNTPPSFVPGISGTPSLVQGDATGGLIPYKNPMALTGYYFSIFSMIPFLGIFLAIAGIIFGIIGLRRLKRTPIIRGSIHAWFAIIFGALVVLVQVLGIFYLMFRYR